MESSIFVVSNMVIFIWFNGSSKTFATNLKDLQSKSYIYFEDCNDRYLEKKKSYMDLHGCRLVPSGDLCKIV